MWLTALLMGLAGSLHCAGMCSPLATAVTHGRTSSMANRLLYNLGRISTYGMLGAAVAALGFLLPLQKFQNVLSVLLGLLLVVMASAGITDVRIPLLTKAAVRFTGWLKRSFSKTMKNKNAGTLLLLGALNGMLPCGLTLLALTFCITLADPLEGFTYMLCFGAGTLPVMLGVVSLIGFFSHKMHWSIRRVTTGLMLLSGLLLIARVFIVHLPEGHTYSDVVDIVICR